MKIYTMSSDSNSLLISDGLPISERYRKDKESGQRSFYPIGTYNLDKARNQYFFLSKWLQDQVNDKTINRVNYVVFKPHNNIPELLIAFPNPKDTEGYLVFDGYDKKDFIMIENNQFEEKPCPFCSIPNKHYHVNLDSDDDSNYYCDFCNSRGIVITNEEQAERIIEEQFADENFNPKALIGKFLHTCSGNVRIYEKSRLNMVENFMDTFAIKMDDGATAKFLIMRKITIDSISQERQFLIEFTHHFRGNPTISIKHLSQRGFIISQFVDLCKDASAYSEYIKHTGPTEGTLSFSFRDIEEDESPFAKLKDVIVDSDNE